VCTTERDEDELVGREDFRWDCHFLFHSRNDISSLPLTDYWKQLKSLRAGVNSAGVLTWTHHTHERNLPVGLHRQLSFRVMDITIRHISVQNCRNKKRFTARFLHIFTFAKQAINVKVISGFYCNPSNAEGCWVFQRWKVLLFMTTFWGPWSASSSGRWNEKFGWASKRRHQ
jgi:hypothetical protein